MLVSLDAVNFLQNLQKCLLFHTKVKIIYVCKIPKTYIKSKENYILYVSAHYIIFCFRHKFYISKLLSSYSVLIVMQ
jgi:hypothetical protein